MPHTFELTPEQRAADARRARLCAVVTAVCACLVFLLVLVGTPLDQFRGKRGKRSGNGSESSEAEDGGSGSEGVCFSYFGRKRCGAHGLSGGRPDRGFPCGKVRDQMLCGAAMAILSILTALGAAVAYGCFAAGVRPPQSRLAGLVLATATFSLLLIAWAMAVQSRDTTCPDATPPRLKDAFSLGPGFGLHVTAWCIQGITFLFILLSWGE